jgi:hypothetical protein
MRVISQDKAPNNVVIVDTRLTAVIQNLDNFPLSLI